MKQQQQEVPVELITFLKSHEKAPPENIKFLYDSSPPFKIFWEALITKITFKRTIYEEEFAW